MIAFKCTTDLNQLPSIDPSRTVIHNLLNDFPRDPDIHGYVVLVQPGDTQIDLPELKCPTVDMSWDGVTRQDGHYHAVYLTNNEHAIEFVIPDAAWLPEDVRANLDAHAGAWVTYLKAPPF